MNNKLYSFGLLWLRVLMGAGIAYHGFGKIFGGGIAGFAQGVAAMGFPFPEIFAWMAALSEFAGGIAVVLGLGTRVASGLIFFTMSVAAFVAHGQDSFAVKELALCYWTMAGALVLLGPGTWSADRFIFKK
ncbi:MAG TPA: DoxX family protein [Candidatus Bathyarchaeia archaeon]|nr:DoxX family protein [Candidatus Bathyarchaeia archaeon]